jgi:DNA-binding protein Fis
MEDKAVNKTYLEKSFEELDDAFMHVNIGTIYKVVVERIEKLLIEKILEKTFGNQIKAAKILGINRNTLRTKMHKLGVTPERWKI